MPAMRSICVVVAIAQASALVAPRVRTTRAPARMAIDPATVLEPIKGPLKAYADIWTPLFTQAKDAGLVPDVLLHWGHPAAMGAVLLTMGLYGPFLGWSIRTGNADTVYPLSLGETSRSLHPKIMAGMLFFFVLGGQGGLILNQVQGHPFLESPHAVSAIASYAVLAAVAAAPLSFPALGANARAAHAYVGSTTMVLLFGHAALGLQLGNSF
ncbi:hypothetical protein M885DRAFT_505815 [Pelagophyceae sp. CCMP2097]|nr:hypothetical protein M885DRAFT_505815 [Pelagophyceae sp. CCMP2097]